MDEKERKTLADKLREELRNERKLRSNEGDRGTIQGGRGSNVAVGSNSQDIGANTDGPDGNTENVRGSYRGTEDKPKRSRQSDRRLVGSHGFSASGGGEAYSSHGLTRADMPIGDSRRSLGTHGKETLENATSAVKSAIFKKKSPLTQKEANEYREPLREALQGYGEDMDKFLRWKTERPQMRDIWGNLSDVEAYALADILLQRGVRNAETAEFVRLIINSQNYKVVGVMAIPRMVATIEELRSTPARPKRQRRWWKGQRHEVAD